MAKRITESTWNYTTFFGPEKKILETQVSKKEPQEKLSK